VRQAAAASLSGSGGTRSKHRPSQVRGTPVSRARGMPACCLALGETPSWRQGAVEMERP
jgi:hypothetical protein